MPLALTSDIQCTITIQDEDYHQEKKIVKIKEIVMLIYSSTKTVHQLRQFLLRLEDEYDEFIKLNMDTRTCCFVYNKTDENCKPKFIKNTFQSTKTFDNLVFRDKDLLKQRLDFFLNNKKFYENLGIPYTLGLLFHGCPGTGKTSTIKAIANYTKRHLIIIPMSKVKSHGTLRDIILNEEIGCCKIPHHKRMYIFEEIDCNGMEKIIASRKNRREISHSESFNVVIKEWTNMQAPTVVNKTQPDVDESDKVTLGGLLELLDGINEATGRMLVMTTNSDPSNFDDALLRPGRIDCKIEFKKFNHQELCMLYEMWFDIKIPDDILAKIKEDAYTPAELGEIFIRSADHPEKILELLAR
jgi:chaperone BCS1